MELKANFDKEYPRFKAIYRELFKKQKGIIEVYLFHFATGIMWDKKVMQGSKYII